jgi:hypothetical protein
LFVLSGLRDAVLEGNGATIRVETQSKLIATVIKLQSFNNLTIQNLFATDTGYDPSVTWWGANIIVASGASAASRGLTLRNLRVNRALSALTVNSPEHRVAGIRIEGDCQWSNVYYGLSCQENGDEISGSFTTIDAIRAYFPYGVTGHDLTVYVQHDGVAVAGESACLIKRYARDTQDIRLHVIFSGVLAYPTAVKLEQQPDAGSGAGRITNIDLTIDIAQGSLDPRHMVHVAFRSFAADGREERQSTGNVWDNIRIGGTFAQQPIPQVISYVSPRSPGRLVLPREVRPSTSLRAFRLLTD